MIGYPIAEDDLLAALDWFAPTWRARAQERTQALRSEGRYAEASAIWCEIKPVFMALQFNKCGFCERRLESERFGRIEHDIEHFRPKGAVQAWPDTAGAASATRRAGYRFKTGGASATGYFLLAYAPLNYLVACKTCNSALKADSFPIAGPRRRCTTPEVAAYASERPFLVYPIGHADEDPERIITFQGILPVPRFKAGPQHRRAVVTIDLFELDTREALLRGRAEKIFAVFLARERLQRDADPATQQALDGLLAPWAEHVSCTSAFNELITRDLAAARRFYEEAAAYLGSGS